MKTGLFLFYFLFLLTQLHLFADSEKDWYPFVIPEKLYADSPANIGKLVLDAPAGKHGFLKTKGNEFIFEDGTPIKFWGTNLCFEACFPDKELAVTLADRLAFFGFNAVRLHHMDSYFEPRGIFKDVVTECNDAHCKKTGILSEKQMDKLDYFIYQLKQRGIYVNMNLLVSRHFTLADGVIEADKLGMAAKPASMFDPKLIELQKQYAKDLLTHYNPYTQLRYCDDPVIAIAEITNENSIVQAWYYNNLNHRLGLIKNNVLPEHYSKQLDQLWQKWLKDKYKKNENLKRAWEIDKHATGTKEIIPIKNTDWTLGTHKKTSAEVKISDTETLIRIFQVPSQSWHIQYFKNHLNLKQNQNYKITFEARSEKPLQIKLLCQQSFSPWKNLGLSESVSLKPGFKTFSFPFRVNSECSNAKIAFILGFSTGTVSIKNIILEKINGFDLPSAKDQQQFSFSRPIYKFKFLYPEKNLENIKQFYTDLERQYFREMTEFLKKNLNLKIPVTGTSFCEETALADCDYLDRHTYWDHAKFPKRRWDKNHFTITGHSMLLDRNLGMLKKITEKYFSEKPRTLTEWNHCFPNPYAYEGPLFMAAESAVHHLNGLFQFAFSDGWKSAPQFNSIQSYFDSYANPQQLILLSLGSLVFLETEKISTTFKDSIYKIDSPEMQAAFGFFKGKKIKLNEFSINPQENGALAVLKTKNGWLINLVGEVKNTNSGWARRKFQWGKGPVLLKRIPADIQLTAKKISGSKFLVFELLPNGARGRKISESSDNQVFSFSTAKCNSPWLEVVNS